MSFRDCLCDAQTRNALARGVVESVNVVGLDMDTYNQLFEFGTEGSIAAKNYLIIFGIVRLAGLYEMIAEKTRPAGVQYMNTLYDQLNDHLTGNHKKPTDAFRFVARITADAEWVG